MDQAIHAGWFMSYEVSVYGGRNSLDIQNIAREPGSYSYIICNHVLEHVEHDDLAVKELLRVLTDDGILQFAVPDPLHHKLTSDWGYPNPKNHGHYRTYGADLLRTRLSPLLQQSVLSVVAQDPVTSYEDVVYFCTKSPALRAELHRALTHYGFCPKEEELSS
jgi:SAM-dependent methyltransferase